MKAITPRKRSFSNKWRKLVLTFLHIPPDQATKNINKEIEDLWFEGWSFKDAASIIKERQQRSDA